MIHIDPDETIQIKIRKHWFIFLSKSIGLLLVLLLPLALYFLISRFESVLNIDLEISIPSSLFIFFASMWTLFVWMKLFFIWTDYYLDIWVVTDKRIIDVEQIGFFKREMSVFRVDRVQDINVDIHGLLATLINFGDIHVQTAGASREFIIRGIPDPHMVKKIICDLQDKLAEKQLQARSSLTSFNP